jgi:hypothetical protein
MGNVRRTGSSCCKLHPTQTKTNTLMELRRGLDISRSLDVGIVNFQRPPRRCPQRSLHGCIVIRAIPSAGQHCVGLYTTNDVIITRHERREHAPNYAMIIDRLRAALETRKKDKKYSRSAILHKVHVRSTSTFNARARDIV